MIEDPLLFPAKRVRFAHRFDSGRVDARHSPSSQLRSKSLWMGKLYSNSLKSR